MAIVIALFIIIVFGLKYATDKSNTAYHSNRINREVNDYFQTLEEFKNKYVDMKMESECLKEAENKSEDAMRMSKEIEDEIGYSTDVLVGIGLLAERGKIPIAFINDRMGNLFMPNTYRSKEDATNMMLKRSKFLIWYNEKLKKYGVHEEMLFVSGEQIDAMNWKQCSNPYPSCCRPILVSSMLEPETRGIYFWEATKRVGSGISIAEFGKPWYLR